MELRHHPVPFFDETQAIIQQECARVHIPQGGLLATTVQQLLIGHLLDDGDIAEGQPDVARET